MKKPTGSLRRPLPGAAFVVLILLVYQTNPAGWLRVGASLPGDSHGYFRIQATSDS
jgi:hypothetical protein